MSKLAIRLLILSMSATALVVAPIVTPVKAATDVSKDKKKKRSRTGALRFAIPQPTRSPRI